MWLQCHHWTLHEFHAKSLGNASRSTRRKMIYSCQIAWLQTMVRLCEVTFRDKTEHPSLATKIRRCKKRSNRSHQLFCPPFLSFLPWRSHIYYMNITLISLVVKFNHAGRYLLFLLLICDWVKKLWQTWSWCYNDKKRWWESRGSVWKKQMRSLCRFLVSYLQEETLGSLTWMGNYNPDEEMKQPQCILRNTIHECNAHSVQFRK